MTDRVAAIRHESRPTQKCARSFQKSIIDDLDRSLTPERVVETAPPSDGTSIEFELYRQDLQKIERMIALLGQVNFSHRPDSSAFFYSVIRLGPTLSKIADWLGVNHGSLSRWARGEGQPGAANHERIRSNLRRFLTEYRTKLKEHLDELPSN